MIRESLSNLQRFAIRFAGVVDASEFGQSITHLFQTGTEPALPTCIRRIFIRQCPSNVPKSPDIYASASATLVLGHQNIADFLEIDRDAALQGRVRRISVGQKSFYLKGIVIGFDGLLMLALRSRERLRLCSQLIERSFCQMELAESRSTRDLRMA